MLQYIQINKIKEILNILKAKIEEGTKVYSKLKTSQINKEISHVSILI